MSDKKYWVFLSEIQACIAYWAVRQSPYHNPDGVNAVLQKFRASIPPAMFDQNEMGKFSREDVKTLLKVYLWPIPEFLKWNELRNGNTDPLGFCSRYDKPHPDNDFIDLDDLTGNVVRELFSNAEREEEIGKRFDRRWFWNTPRRWLYRIFPRRVSMPTCPTNDPSK